MTTIYPKKPQNPKRDDQACARETDRDPQSLVGSVVRGRNSGAADDRRQRVQWRANPERRGGFWECVPALGVRRRRPASGHFGLCPRVSTASGSTWRQSRRWDLGVLGRWGREAAGRLPSFGGAARGSRVGLERRPAWGTGTGACEERANVRGRRWPRSLPRCGDC